MKFLDQLQVLDRLDQLIRLKATGNSQALADRLGISFRSVYNLIAILKDLGAQIFYCRDRQSYYYANEVSFNFSAVLSLLK